MNLYIGLDAHSTSSTFVAFNERGKEVLCTRVPTSEKEIKGVLRSLKGSKHIAFEESNMSRWLYVCLKPEVEKLLVCAPQHFHKKPGAKTDARDSRYLAEELRKGSLVEVYHNEADTLLELRSLVSGYADVVRDLVRCKNQFKALFRSQAIVDYDSKIYSDPDFIKKLNNKWDQFTADNLMFRIGMLEESKKSYVEVFKSNVRKEKSIKLLTTIPGIDIIRANQIAAVTCDPRRFKNKHRYWSYCMLIKHKQISNQRTYGSRHAYGRSELKDIFMGCTLNQIVGNTAFRKFYDLLISKGLTPKKARKALARKTAAIALSIMKSGRRYNDNWEREDQKLIKG